HPSLLRRPLEASRGAVERLALGPSVTAWRSGSRPTATPLRPPTAPPTVPRGRMAPTRPVSHPRAAVGVWGHRPTTSPPDDPTNRTERPDGPDQTGQPSTSSRGGVGAVPPHNRGSGWGGTRTHHSPPTALGLLRRGRRSPPSPSRTSRRSSRDRKSTRLNSSHV